MLNKLKQKQLLAAILLSTLVHASEPGSGFYAKECKDPVGSYNLFINNDGTAVVETEKKLYKNVLTSYSYFGHDTPQNFKVAILFDYKNPPVKPANKNDDPRLEIWKEGKGFYALVNGDKKQKLKLCKVNP